MTEVMQVATADERAARAAEELASEGASVTGAAVRERSGVRMSTAHAAAKAWREREKAVDEATESAPEQLQSRFLTAFEGAWREARALARADFDEARAGWEAKLHEAAKESAKLTVAVDELEQENERIASEVKAAATQANEEIAVARALASERAADQAAQLAAERSRADRAEGALEAITGERDRLLIEVQASRAK